MILTSLLLTLVLHEAPICQWAADLVGHEGQLILHNEVSNCETFPFDTMLDEFGIVMIGMPQYLIMFALPVGTTGGYVSYSFASVYAMVNGQKITVLIELREDI